MPVNPSKPTRGALKRMSAGGALERVPCQKYTPAARSTCECFSRTRRPVWVCGGSRRGQRCIPSASPPGGTRPPGYGPPLQHIICSLKSYSPANRTGSPQSFRCNTTLSHCDTALSHRDTVTVTQSPQHSTHKQVSDENTTRKQVPC